MTRYLTHGPNAVETVELDFELTAFLFTGNGSIIHGTIDANGIFTPSGGTQQPVYRMDRALRELDCLAGLFGLVDMQREAHVDIFCTAAAGSTTTVIQVQETLPTSGAGSGKWLAIGDDEDGKPRPIYLVDSVAANAITLAAAMTQDPPAAGAPLCLKAARKPRPNPAHFTLPAIGFKVGSQWCVLEKTSRVIFAASLVSGQLDKVSVGTINVDLDVGATAGNANVVVTHKPRGLWNWVNAVVSNLLAAAMHFTATDRLLGRATAGAGPGEQITCTAAGRALIDDASAAAQRTTLGLGDLATTNASSLAVPVSLTLHATGRILIGAALADPPTLALADSLEVETTDPANHIGIAFCNNGYITWWALTVEFPEEWDLGADIGCVVRWVMNGAGTASDDVELAFRWGLYKNNEVVGASSEETEVRQTFDVSGAGAATLVDCDLGVVIGGGALDPGSAVHFVIERNALAGNTPDDYEDAGGIASVRFYGTRRVTA